MMAVLLFFTPSKRARVSSATAQQKLIFFERNRVAESEPSRALPPAMFVPLDYNNGARVSGCRPFVEVA